MTVYSRAKRAKEKEGKLNKKKVATCIIIAIILIVIAYLFISNRFWEIKSENVEEVANVEETVEEVVEESPTPIPEDEIVNTDDIPEKMGKYDVLGQLVIDKIGVTKNILSKTEDGSLKQSVTKLYGPELNKSGNFCVSGHNWKSMLKRLSEMQVGDTFYMINKETKAKVNYEIYNIYTCVPEDVSCLNQNSDGKREATIITCNPGGATRLILKAREKATAA